MEILLYILGALVFTWIFSDLLRKRGEIFFIIATIVSIYGAFFSEYNLINQPYLGLGFLVVMMYVGALDLTKWYAKKIKAVRGKLAIIGFILIAAHVWYHFSLQFHFGRMMGSLSFLIMVPLFITSFKTIKSRIKKSKWNKLHKLAYFAYFFIFVHAFLQATEVAHQVIVVAIFGTYLVKRLLKARKAKQKRAEIETRKEK